jgi:hypothetical protein
MKDIKYKLALNRALSYRFRGFLKLDGGGSQGHSLDLLDYMAKIEEEWSQGFIL